MLTYNTTFGKLLFSKPKLRRTLDTFNQPLTSIGRVGFSKRPFILKPRAESLYIRGAVEEYTARTVEELGGMDLRTAGDKAMLLAQRCW